MLNNMEMKRWTEAYPDFFKSIYKKGIYYYMNKLPGIGLIINNVAHNDKMKCWSKWSMRQWFAYFLVYEQYEGSIAFLDKYISYFSQFSSFPALVKELSYNAEKANLAKLRDIETVRQRLNVQFILGDNDRIRTKVRVSHSGSHMWNAIQTVAESLRQKEGFDVEIILCSTDQKELSKMKKQMEEGRYRYICIQDYDVENDKPDIVIFYIVHDEVYFKQWGGMDKIRRNTKYIAVVPYDNAVKFESNIRMDTYYGLLKRLNEDIFIVAKPIYKMIKDRYANIIQMDSPKFDIIYRKMNDNINILENWEKLKEKKLILWTTVHGHDERDLNKFFKCVSFDLYIKEVIDYFKKHQNMGLIFRPHPAYINELVYQHKIWTEEDLLKIKDFFNNSSNMVWDDSTDYSSAFAMSDALLTDDGTGITLSYLPTRKPICILRRNAVEVFTGTLEITENYYKAHDFSEVEDYFEMIEYREDPLFENRMRTVEEFVSDFDGKNGMRIADKIVDDFQNKYL